MEKVIYYLCNVLFLALYMANQNSLYQPETESEHGN